MSDKYLSDDMIKLVKYSIVSIERGHTRILVCNRCEVFSDNMRDCDFVSSVIAEYCQHHYIPPEETNSLRVTFEVLDRWPRGSLEFESKQLRRLDGIALSILKCCGKLPGGGKTGEVEETPEIEAVGDVEEQPEVEAVEEQPEIEAVEDVEEQPEIEAVEGVEEQPEIEAAENVEEQIVVPDDLTRIEGVGPQINKQLQAAGLITFAQVAAAGASRLRSILTDAGPRFRLADPATWPAQARLAAAGEWDALKALQEELKGGRAAGKTAIAAAEAPAATPAAELDEGARQVLEALETLDGQAAMGALVKQTGSSRATVRRRLHQLTQAGLVERVGEGPRTRYRRVKT